MSRAQPSRRTASKASPEALSVTLVVAALTSIVTVVRAAKRSVFASGVSETS